MNKQKKHPAFVSHQLWASPSRAPEVRKMNTILGKIKKGICEHIGRSGESVIIDRPSNSVYSIESGGQLKTVASVEANFAVTQDDPVLESFENHCQSLIQIVKNRKYARSSSFHPHTLVGLHLPQNLELLQYIVKTRA